MSCIKAKQSLEEVKNIFKCNKSVASSISTYIEYRCMCLFFALRRNMKKIKVNLYIDGMCVKSVKRPEGSKFTHEIYKVWIIGHKDIFNKHIVKMSLKPMQIIDTDDKSIDLNCVVYGGVNID